jgi:TonB-dependent receptor
MNVYAGYSMVDLNLGPRWRVSGGLRVEAADQEVVTIDNQIPNAAPVVASLQNTDPIPAVNLVYAVSKRQNLRVSYSRTLSRPDFRELSPFDFTNVQGGFVTVGNANLKRASIDNYDVRWEVYPGGNQLIAASFFVKKFKDPIEQTVIVSNDLRQSYTNAKGARNFGFELEFRHSLGSVSKALNEFSLNSNFTLVDSNIDIRPEDALVLTSKSRPLVGQSRYVFNGAIQWARPKWHSDAQFVSNHVSRRISDVGSYGLPDLYQEATSSMDFSYQYRHGERAKWGIRFEAENLTDNDYHWTQGNILQRQYRLGRTFQIGVNYSFF